MKKLLVDFTTSYTAGGSVSSPKDVPQTWQKKIFFVRRYRLLTKC
jgi:hypothetical protein